MKKNILFIGILIFSLNCISQNQKATIYLRSGDTIQGLVKFTSFGIKFRYDKQSKKENYDAKKIIKLDINEQGKTNTYVYKLAKDYGHSATPKLMTLITKGKINLYRIIITNTSFQMHGIIAVASTHSMEHYYVCRNNSDVVTRLTTVGTFLDKNFIKAASEYFSDCQDVVNRIKNKNYRKKDMEEIVKLYNRSCK